MPSDTYTLTISDAGVSVPSSHASTHLTGGSDPIPVATTSTSGLMSAAIFNQHVTNTNKAPNATHTGDVTDASGVLTVNGIKGVSLAGLGGGVLKVAATTGIPSIASAPDFPTLNQSTTGTAATATNLIGGGAGAIPYQTAANTTAMLAAGTSGHVLKSNGSSPPTWEPVSLSSGLSGSLPVSSGGTGATTLTGIVKGNGTSTFTTVTAPAGDIVGTTDIQTLTNKTLGTGTTIGVLGTPSSGTLTNCTGLPIDGGTSGTLPVARGGSGAVTLTGILKGNGTSAFTAVTAPTGVLVGTTDTQTLTNKTFGSGTTISAIGTPTSGTLTNCTGLPISNGTTGTLPVDRGGTGAAILSGILVGNGTNAFTTVTAPVGAIVGTTDTQTLTNKTLGSGTTVTNIGTPNSGTLTNCTGLPISGLVSSTSTALGVGSIELGHATDTTISRVSAGRIAVEGVNVVTTSSTDTLTNKTLVAPALGTPTSGTLTSCTGLPIVDGTTGTLSIARGGTGETSFPVSSLIVSGPSSTTDPFEPLSYGISGQYLRSNGIGVVPSFSDIDLDLANTSGTLAADRGGTGLTNTTPRAILIGGTSAGGTLSQVTAGTSGQILLSQGSAANPTWLSSGTAGQVLTSTGFGSNPTWTNNTRSYGVLALVTGVSSQVTTTTLSQITGTNGSLDTAVSFGFTGTNYTLTYTGTTTSLFKIDARLDITSTAANDVIIVRLAKGSATIANSESRNFTGGTLGGTDNSHLCPISTSYIVSLATNETVTVFIAHGGTGTINTIVRRFEMVATQV